jgi:hypothetical protein
MRPACCANTARGHAAIAPPSIVMNSRRCMWLQEKTAALSKHVAMLSG